ncbi:MAG: ammonia-forming cytochrome c nitrite reductase subunit c552 [Polyangiaceae bacterium]
MATVLFVALLVGFAIIVARRARREPAGWALVLTLALSPLTLWMRPTSEPLPAGLPKVTPRGQYIGSDACLACHPAEHESWLRTYHRSMTRVARGDAILAPLGRSDLEIDGRSIVVEREPDRLFITMPDPGALASSVEALGDVVPSVRREVVMTTGSHHYQAYWVRGMRDGELRAAPVVWHRELGRFVPRHDVFLQPADERDRLVRWNSNCLVCHATAAQPRHDLAADKFDTESVELGIACEACHGPGGAHAERYRDPLERRLAETEDTPAADIVNPAKIDKERSAEICGQCHAYTYPKDEEEWWAYGFTRTFTPGKPLSDSRYILGRDSGAGPGFKLDAARESLFWGDGTIRVSGREFNALSSSACFTRGSGERRVACVDCHSLHRSDPDDQLGDDGKTGAACTSCHEGFAERSHTHHDSVGCYDCHMPRVSYALYRTQRSHRIDSPSARRARETGRPPACNLCHVDRSLEWTARELERTFSMRAEVASENPDEEALPFVVEMALSGDAAARVVAADHLASPETTAAVTSRDGRALAAAALAELLVDPYSAVRVVASRALEGLGLLRSGEYDFLGDDRAAARALVLSRIDGPFDAAAVARALARRDDRPMLIAE